MIAAVLAPRTRFSVPYPELHALASAEWLKVAGGLFALLVVCWIGPGRIHTWAQRFADSNLFKSRPACGRIRRLSLSFPFQVALICGVSLLLLQRSSAFLFQYYDGAYMRQLAKFNFEWTSPRIAYPLSPLQGLGGYNFPTNFWSSPSVVFSGLLSGPVVSPLLVYTVCSLLFFCSLWFLADSLSLTPRQRIAASWAGCICVLPFVTPVDGTPVSFYGISSIVPHVVEHLAVSNVILGLLLRLRLEAPALDLRVLGGILVLTIYSFVAFYGGIILSLPVWAFFGAVSVAPSLRGRVARWRLLGVVAVFLVVLSLPLSTLALSLSYSVPTFFSTELISRRAVLGFTSVLFHGVSGQGWGGTAVYVAGFAGGLLAIRTGTGPLKRVGLGLVVIQSLLLGAGLLAGFVFTSFRGPSFLYFEWYTWSLMFVLGVHFLTAVGRWLARLLRRARPESLLLRLLRVSRSWGGLAVPLAACVFALWFSRPIPAPMVPMPPARTLLVAYVAEHVELKPGTAWRGAVATFAGIDTDEPTDWPRNMEFDVGQWIRHGNDLRAMGLWWHNIPTLFAYNQYITPFTYYALTRFFARPLDLQERNVFVMTTPRPRLLALFGARFLISDQDLGDLAGISPVGTAQLGGSLPEDHPCLYEIAEPNLGDVSPTEAIRVGSAAEAVVTMQRGGFDPRVQFVTRSSESFELVTATDTELIWEREGVRVRARSAGRSLLVLPLEFSHTLSAVVPGSGQAPRLIRVDVALTGVLFSGELDALITPTLGPFSGVQGRLRDLQDAKEAGF